MTAAPGHLTVALANRYRIERELGRGGPAITSAIADFEQASVLDNTFARAWRGWRARASRPSGRCGSTPRAVALEPTNIAALSIMTQGYAQVRRRVRLREERAPGGVRLGAVTSRNGSSTCAAPLTLPGATDVS